MRVPVGKIPLSSIERVELNPEENKFTVEFKGGNRSRGNKPYLSLPGGRGVLGGKPGSRGREHARFLVPSPGCFRCRGVNLGCEGGFLVFAPESGTRARIINQIVRCWRRLQASSRAVFDMWTAVLKDPQGALQTLDHVRRVQRTLEMGGKFLDKRHNGFGPSSTTTILG